MIIYVLKSITCLSLLLFFYHFILEKEKMHSFNRFYLLGSVLFSLLVPLATITTIKKIEPIIVNKTSLTVDEFSTIIIKETFDYTELFIVIYILISFVFLIRFGMNFFKIIKKIRVSDKIEFKKAALILVDDKILPHTFWNSIFINKNDYKNGKIEEELFTHELTHVTQKHTLDVVLIELVQIIFWINPLFIFTKKAIQLNHEFLADETVIKQHKNTFQYQYLLLNKAAWNNAYYLASNLNYSLTKKRLEMMTTQSSNTKILFKKLSVIPLLAGFVFLFAERVEAQKKEEIIYEQSKSIQKKHKTNAGEIREVISEITTLYDIKKYQKSYNLYESKRKQKPHFVKSSKERQNGLKESFSLLESLYFKLSKEDKKKVKRPTLPHDPYLKLRKKNKVFYKLRNELTKEDELLIPPPPPIPNASKKQILKAKKAYKEWQKRSGNDFAPPPPPRNHLDQVIKMAKKGAKFYFEKQPISSDKAIALLKKDKKLSIHSESTNYSNYKVWISKTPLKPNNDKPNKVTNLNKLEKFKKDNTIIYYLNGKIISKKEIDKLNPNDIKTINVKKEKDGSGVIYIIKK